MRDQSKMYTIKIGKEVYKVSKQVHLLMFRLMEERDLFRDLTVSKVGNKAIDVVGGIYGEIIQIFKDYESIPKDLGKKINIDEMIDDMFVLDWQLNYRWCILKTEDERIIPFPECRLLNILDNNFNPNEIDETVGGSVSDI